MVSSQHKQEIYAAVCNHVIAKTDESVSDLILGKSLLAILQLYQKHPDVLDKIYHGVLLPHAEVSSLCDAPQRDSEEMV